MCHMYHAVLPMVMRLCHNVSRNLAIRSDINILRHTNSITRK